MAKEKKSDVTMRIRVGDNELEVSGPQDFVKTQITEFLANQKKVGNLDTAKPTAREARSTDKTQSSAQFIRQANAKTDVDRVLAFGFYLEKYKNSQGFTSAEIREGLKEARQNPPKNTNDAINANIKKGLIMPAGDKDKMRAFVLTSDGEDAVNEMLKS